MPVSLRSRPTNGAHSPMLLIDVILLARSN
jgi:hypothetical protein